MTSSPTVVPFKFPVLLLVLVTWCLTRSAAHARPAADYAAQDNGDSEEHVQPTPLPPAYRRDVARQPPPPPPTFEELMLSDTPVTEMMPDVMGDAVETMRESPVESFEDDEARDKQMRIKSIQNTIVSYMGWASRTPSQIPVAKTPANISMLIPSIQQTDAMRALYDANVNSFPTTYSSDSFTEKIQSFYPVCELPKNTNEEDWNSKDTMNLIFNISVPKASNGVSVNVSAVKLRLFKQYVSCYFSLSSNETDDAQASCQSTSSEENIKRFPNANSSSSSSSAENPSSSSTDDDMIRVSVYVRSLKKKKVKRKLLDSQMFSLHGDRWTEWNIHRAVKNWRNPVRNFALSIEVEDEYGNFLPVNRFFKPMNCTGDAQTTTSKPVPGFLTEKVRFGEPPGSGNEAANMSAAQALSLNIYRYPIVDVTTVESLPEPEDVEYHQQAAKDTLFAQDHRRIRHSGGNRHKINATDLQTAVAKLQQQQQQLLLQHAATDTPTTTAEIPD